MRGWKLALTKSGSFSFPMSRREIFRYAGRADGKTNSATLLPNRAEQRLPSTNFSKISVCQKKSSKWPLPMRLSITPMAFILTYPSSTGILTKEILWIKNSSRGDFAMKSAGKEHGTRRNGCHSLNNWSMKLLQTMSRLFTALKTGYHYKAISCSYLAVYALNEIDVTIYTELSLCCRT